MKNNELTHWGVKGMKWGVRRYQNKDGSLTNAGKKRYNDPHDDYKKAHDRKSVKYMSDKELRERNNRLNMEVQYADLKRKTNRGKRAVDTYIKTAGTIAAIAGATYTYKKYGKEFADKVIDVVGDYVVNEVVKGFN